MRRSPRCVVLLALVFPFSATRLVADDREGVTFFEQKIRPVLVEHCYRCHSAEASKVKGDLKLDSRDALRKGGTSGPAVEPGKPDESLLIQAIAQSGEVAKMPPKGKLPEAVVADFRRWVEMGAPDPREGKAVAKAVTNPRDWWSLRPIAKPALPSLDPEGQRWARTPIDAFVLAKLNEKRLAPAAEADRRTLIRRLSFDLIGLPPTPEETAAFVADKASDAYERLVDRLLDSPHYGERWARHWMDAVHFAETHGHDQDRIRENAWPYRDYLVEAFNRDTPYARFVEEQLAADVLYPDEPRLAVALGFIAAGPWDESSLRDIREDSIDREIGHYLDRDDMVSTAMSTFTSSTVLCARCHDHKFDPIPQADYYALQADFAGVERANRAYDPDAAIHRRRRDLKARQAALQRNDPALLASLLEPRFQAEVASWESDLRASRVVWTPLDPSELKSAGGATLTKQADFSVLSSGPRPVEETTTIVAQTTLRGITAVRLEVLPDDRLPSRGPGRNDNGNLHLTEFRLSAAPVGKPGEARPIAVTRAVADFDQAGWGVAAAIDGNAQTAWGIYPEVAKPHEAAFELKEDVGFEGGTALTIALQQTFPAGHPIGRFRLSVTNAARPARLKALPEVVARISAVPDAERTRDQKIELARRYLAETLERDLAALPPQRFVYAGASDFLPDGSHKPPGKPRPVRVLARGDIHKPGPLAAPGALSCLDHRPARFANAEDADEGARRAALARWISDPHNPLTWRSIVNRVWHHHFGRGLVDTPNDFGRMGAAPTHPELIDWLAATFLEEGGSLKRLHRVIVTSAVYRQASRHDPRAAAVDGDNRLLWRMNRTRLDAEEVRDAVLQISGRLDPTMGGPSVRHFGLRPGVHVTPVVDYAEFDWNAPGAGRRSVYRFVFRTLPDPFMDTLDGADASQLTAARNVSVTPLQSLALLNDAFILRQSEQFARRLEGTASALEGQIRAAYELALGRTPTPDETREWADYTRRHGLANFCRMLLNTNEFMFIF
ncbi:MAG: PSD1 and planctomycete cytochrome C domain-containing protein [Isosphaeraceae bacterium]|nr:PSD1 and planctomycete cytochrome C domain-containing protein [Isosphaeraceae bacterium]